MKPTTFFVIFILILTYFTISYIDYKLDPIDEKIDILQTTFEKGITITIE